MYRLSVVERRVSDIEAQISVEILDQVDGGKDRLEGDQDRANPVRIIGQVRSP
jgi:hypothetical protein